MIIEALFATKEFVVASPRADMLYVCLSLLDIVLVICHGLLCRLKRLTAIVISRLVVELLCVGLFVVALYLAPNINDINSWHLMMFYIISAVIALVMAPIAIIHLIDMGSAIRWWIFRRDRLH